MDPGDLTTELLNPGTLYVALSRAKSIGTITPNELHPKDSALFWTGSGMYLNRVLNVTQKKGDNGNMINCLKVDQRQRWVDHLFERNRITTTKQYNAKRMQKIERKLPRQIENLTKIDLQNAIATMITKPNKSWNNLRSRNYLVPRSYFQ